PHLLRHLRVVELLIFGGSAALFGTLSYVTLAESARQGFIAGINGPWVLLIFTYAMFVPNAWRRAAVVIGMAAAIPVVLMMGFYWFSPEFQTVFANDPENVGKVFGTFMSMCLAAVIAVVGVRTINTLRREAFEARRLGQYQLRKPLGAGGMGEVYLAEHVMLKRPCALKLVRPERAGDPETLARFEREVQSTAKLSHWNTVDVFDYGRADDGTFYYVMEYLPGMNLEQLIRMTGRMSAERVIYLITQVCEALSEAHELGLIHRDIKPANVFAARRGGHYDVAKLLDFGLVRPTIQTTDLSLTQEGVVTGSPLYIPPEQAIGDTPDARSDIYSLGAVIYYLLTERPPFWDENPMKVLLAHARDVPPSPREFVAELPVDLEHIILRCLEKAPSHRFQSADELRDALLACTSAGDWNRELAQRWWHENGCPVKKKLDAEVLGLATVSV
ncbi:MAG: serine/threonine protein kinase, partial [Planctomycetales bacterium]|nr:serine/threonine protein kinase [Planctomycetales bacterium]